ncbi:MAG: alpha/beta hydrolase [Abyssibacter sp.]|uniref:alpha/beta fold hydrolase n=1 Tax=Abyssibacter sp. TaxID=2320200 RepID=UPI00321B9F85
MGARVVGLVPGIGLGRSVSGLGALLFCMGLAGCLGPPYETGCPSDIAPGAQSFRQTVDGRSLHWVEAGPQDGQPVLLLHGTPGSWAAWGEYFKSPDLGDYRLIAVDRPGFGDSAEAGVETRLQVQADVLAALLEARGPLLVVGHSLGGSLAIRLLRDHPEQVRGVVLVAASLDPAAEAPRWFNRVADWPLLRAVLPQPLARANAEVLALQDELDALWRGWTPDRTPVVLIQGMDDRLVWPETAAFAEAQWARGGLQVQRVEQAGHFIVWEQPERVVRALQQVAAP